MATGIPAENALNPISIDARPPGRSSASDSINIGDMIHNRQLVAYFQPIVSIARKNICGFEGLIRGLDEENNVVIPPSTLFQAADYQGLQVELDRACRETVIRTFATQCEKRDILLFLNINSSILDRVVGSNHLANMVQYYGINPNTIVIEINESKIKENQLLKYFVDRYRSYGFLIALDDVGCGFSNLDRIPLIRPDIVKTDISLVRNICTDFYVQEVFRCLVNLSLKIGALVVAEGTETEQEAIQTLELGANLVQGYCISRPQEMNRQLYVSAEERIQIVADQFRCSERDTMVWSKKRFTQFSAIASELMGRLAQKSVNDFDGELLKTVNSNDEIECAYILDEMGIQSSSTIFSSLISGIKNNLLFSPAKIGADHSLKAYYRHLSDANNHQNLTEPYASLASGNPCITYTDAFYDKQNSRFILCIDFKAGTNHQTAR